MKFLLDKGEKVLYSLKSNIFPLKNQTLESAPDSQVIFIHLKWAKSQTKISKCKISPFNYMKILKMKLEILTIYKYWNI